MWTVLGQGFVVLRLGVLLISYAIAIGIGRYLAYVETTYRDPLGTWYVTCQKLVRLTDERHRRHDNSWAGWLWLNAAPLAAVLFLRASGYRLIKTRS